MYKLKRLGIICLVLLFPLTFFAENTRCECGEFSNGITVYEVNGENSDCCEDLTVGDASIVTYTQQSNGVWTITNVTPESGHLAQDHCCENS